MAEGGNGGGEKRSLWNAVKSYLGLDKSSKVPDGYEAFNPEQHKNSTTLIPKTEAQRASRTDDGRAVVRRQHGLVREDRVAQEEALGVRPALSTQETPQERELTPGRPVGPPSRFEGNRATTEGNVADMNTSAAGTADEVAEEKRRHPTGERSQGKSSPLKLVVDNEPKSPKPPRPPRSPRPRPA